MNARELRKSNWTAARGDGARRRGFPKTIINELLSAGYPGCFDVARHYPRFTRAPPSEIVGDDSTIEQGNRGVTEGGTRETRRLT